MQKLACISAAMILSLCTVSFAETHSKPIPHVAVGSYMQPNRGDIKPLIASSSTNGQSWVFPQGSAIELPQDYKGYASLDKAACNQQYCVAIGTYSSQGYSLLVEVSVDQGHSWKYVPIRPPEAQGNVEVGATACYSQGCFIAGKYKNTERQTTLFIAESKTGSDWIYHSLDIPLTQEREPYSINQITCTEKSCIVTGASTRKGYYDLLSFVAMTKDQGISWTFPAIPPTKYLEALHCNSDVCLLSGSNADKKFPTIWASYNSGETWQQASVPAVPTKSEFVTLSQLKCEGSTCVGVGDVFEESPFFIYPLLITSQDKGLTWFYAKSNISSLGSQDIELFDVSCKGVFCVAVGGYVPLGGENHCSTEPLVMMSQDSGVTWSYKTLSSNSLTQHPISPSFCDRGALFGVYCDSGICIVTGQRLDTKQRTYTPLLFTTQDKGDTWISPWSRDLLPLDFASGGFDHGHQLTKRKKG